MYHTHIYTQSTNRVVAEILLSILHVAKHWSGVLCKSSVTFNCWAVCLSDPSLWLYALLPETFLFFFSSILHLTTKVTEIFCCTLGINVSRHLGGCQNAKIQQSKVYSGLFIIEQVYIYVSLESVIDKIWTSLMLEKRKHHIKLLMHCCYNGCIYIQHVII